jgi:hypothetical protein
MCQNKDLASTAMTFRIIRNPIRRAGTKNANGPPANTSVSINTFVQWIRRRASANLALDSTRSDIERITKWTPQMD